MVWNAREMAMAVAHRAKAIRLERGWTQREFSERAGLAFGTYQAFELKGSISLERLCRISVALARASEIQNLFEPASLRSIDELNEKPARKRGRRKR